MKYDLKKTLIIISLFFFAQVIGLWIMSKNFEFYGVESFENEEVMSDALYSLPLAVITLSIAFIIIYKMKFKKLLLYWYGFAFVSCVTISLSAFINEYYALIIAICLVLLKLTSKDNYFHNMCELLVYGGIAVIILPLLSTFSAIMLLIIISVYDYIAVRMSKHMITLAKTQHNLNIFSGLKISTKDSTAMLGGGDIAFPLILAGVILRDYSLIGAILVIYGSLIGLISLILIGRENKFYPAMPFISAGCFLGLFFNFFLL
jgi:presenilin-like A22 family membrane protease